MAFAGNGVAQVFVEAGLANGFDDDVVAFWDELAARARGLRDVKLSEFGREGEKLTIKQMMKLENPWDDYFEYKIRV